MLSKVYKTPDNDLSYELDLKSVLEDRTISSISLIDADNLTVTGLAISGTKVICSFEDGTDNTEYTVIIRATFSDGSKYRIVQSVVVDEDLIEYYGSSYDGSRYFEDKLASDYWTNADAATRRKALIEATSIIDRLNFYSTKTDESQKLQFPRNEETDIPDDVNFAAYEVSILLISGLRPEDYIANAGVKSDAFESLKVTYTDTVPQHISTGLMSPKALMYLLPYLRVSGSVDIKRVS